MASAEGFVPGGREDALSFDDLGPRVVECKPCGAVYLGHVDEPSAFRWPFDFAGYALDTGGIEIAGHGKRCNPLAARLKSLAEREKGTSLTAASSAVSSAPNSPFGTDQLLRSLLRQNGPPGWTSKTDRRGET
jgi:hypothetical protein